MVAVFSEDDRTGLVVERESIRTVNPCLPNVFRALDTMGVESCMPGICRETVDRFEDGGLEFGRLSMKSPPERRGDDELHSSSALSNHMIASREVSNWRP